MTERDKLPDTLPDATHQNRDVQVYDFTSPSRLSREQVRRIEYLHNMFVRRVSMSLAALLRGFVQASVTSVGETAYSQFVESIPSPGATFTFSAEPLEGVGILDLDPKVAFAIIDRVLGGKGEPIGRLRELTTIEQTVAARVAEGIVKELESAWNALSHLSMELAGFMSSPDVSQVYAGNTSVVVVDIKLATEASEGAMRIAYPYAMFEPALRDMTKTQAFVSKKHPDKDAMAQLLRAVPVEISVRLPDSMVRMREIANIRVGDVLVLDTHVDDEIDILAQGRKVFEGRPGRSRTRLAVKISRMIRDGGSEDDT